MFRPQLWPQGEDYWGNPFNKAAAKPQDVREVWFAGVHGDVGGGYPEAESGLACHSACNIDPLSRGIGVQN
jgi:hypothetical protein